MKDYTFELGGTVSLDEREFITEILPHSYYADGEVTTHHIIDPQDLQRITQFLISRLCISSAYIHEDKLFNQRALHISLSPEMAEIFRISDIDEFTLYIEQDTP